LIASLTGFATNVPNVANATGAATAPTTPMRRQLGSLTLDAAGIHGPQGFVALSPIAVAILKQLAEAGDFVPAFELALAVLRRRDPAAQAAIRQHIAVIRRQLGPLGTILRTVPKRGYGLAVSRD
jgi:DNA-binding winged helix-turn-helix (wHTH) protein